MAAEQFADERRPWVSRSTPTRLEMAEHLSFREWKALGNKIGMYSSATAWWLGDWLAFGQKRYGGRYREGVAVTGLTYQTLRNYCVVARRFDVSRRRDTLTFQHHAEVCALTDEDQDFWLDLAAEMKWSKAELRRRVRASADQERREAVNGTLRLVVEPHREERWREAARQNDTTLEQWIIDAVDAAASESLDPRTDESDDAPLLRSA